MTLSKGLLKQQEPKFYINKDWLYQKYYVENLSFKKISILLGCRSYEPVTRHMKLYGFKTKSTNQYPRIIKQKHYIEIDKDWLYQKYYTEEMPASAIAKLLQVTGTTVLRKLKQYGFITRTKSEEFSGKRNPVYGIRGEAHHAYKKDAERIGPLITLIRNHHKTTSWRKEVLSRDNYTCTNINCGSQEKLHVDHIKPLALIIAENNISSLEEAKEYEMLWDINNGRTLCKECHIKTDTWGRGPKKINKELKNG